jgi:predicted RNA-binding protein with PIN domain
VVFDAARESSEQLAGNYRVEVAFAASADDYIVEKTREVRGESSERQVYVVSSDRQLLDRSRRYATERLSPWQFKESCTSSGTD